MCWHNNLTLNVSKTKEMIVDFHKQVTPHSLIYIRKDAVEQVISFKFL